MNKRDIKRHIHVFTQIDDNTRKFQTRRNKNNMVEPNKYSYKMVGKI